MSYFKRRIQDIYYEIRNRYFVKYYRIDIRVMPKGAWWDFDQRSFHIMFQLFEDYVIREAGRSSFDAWRINKETKYYNIDAVNYYENLSFIQKFLKRKEIYKNFALAHFRWEIDLKHDSSRYEEELNMNTHQSDIAKKKLELFNWWFNVRPYRLEPYESESSIDIVKYVDRETGLPCEPFKSKKLEDGNFLVISEMTPEYRKWFLSQVELETQHYNEDTEMMKKLCDIRSALWV